MDSKGEAIEAINRAKEDLDDALSRLAKLPPIDTDRLSYTAHALNNYLMVVSTISQLMKRALARDARAEAEDRLGALDHATALMKAAVQQLVLPTDDDRPKLIFLNEDLRRIVSAVCDEYEPIAAAKQIVVTRAAAPAAIVVTTDRIALGVVFDNVISNAVKYSPSGGVIRVTVSASDKEGICAIADMGPGIAPHEAARLFTRGGRLSARPSGGETSTGYGLVIAKDLLNELRGRIWHENRPEGGSVFFVALPLAAPSRD